MKVAFVTTGQETLGIEYISSVLKQNGHEVRLFFDPQTFGGGISLRIEFLRRKFDLMEKIVAGVIEYQPDIIGFSCMTHNYLWSVQVAQRIKQIQNIPVIFGGIHPTSVPEHVLANECVDMVAVGEGESSFPELIDTMQSGSHSTDIRGIYFKENGRIIKNRIYPLQDDLDSLPYPDKPLFYDKVPGLRDPYCIMTSRGCPFTCTYCCNDLLNNLYDGKYRIRRRSVDNVIEELRLAKANFKIREVYFTDEVFSFNIDWLKKFSLRYKSEIGLPFTIYFHFKFVTEERVKLLKDAGCYLVLFGMQSASEWVRKEVCKRNYSNEEAANAIKLCKKYDIIVYCDHIFGLPYEGEEGWSQAVEFYRDASPDAIYSYWLTYYPATSIIEKGREAGLLKEEDMEQILDGEGSFYHKGTVTKNRGSMLTYQLLFDMVPLLPRSMHRWATNNQWILKAIPKGYIPHFMLNFIARLKAGDPIFRRITLAMSKKNVP